MKGSYIGIFGYYGKVKFQGRMNYYISTTGSDLTGDGSFNNPWQTLYKASTSVTIPNSKIIILNGTYTENTICEFSPRVSIEGESRAGVILTTTNGAANFRIISFVGAVENSDGYQSVSNLTIDCNMVGYRGIYVYMCNNIQIYNCTIIDCTNSGIVFDGSIGAGEPVIYSENNMVYDCTITNCADFTNHGGCLLIGGQVNMSIHDNTITQPDRGALLNGYPVTFVSNGYYRGLKFYNNYLYRFWRASEFNICFEGWHHQGSEIYDNEFVDGAMDLSWSQLKGVYGYTYYLHDNHCHSLAVPAIEDPTYGIVVEGETRDVFICRNLVENLNHGISVSSYLAGNITERIYIYNNIVHNWGNSGGIVGDAFRIGGTNVGAILRNVYVFNNVFYDNDDSARYVFWLNAVNSTNENIFVVNNIIMSGQTRWLYSSTTGAATYDKCVFNNNILFRNGNANVANLTVVPANYFLDDNIIADPLMVDPNNGNFHLGVGSPAIDAGMSWNFQSVYFDWSLISRADPPDIGIFEF